MSPKYKVDLEIHNKKGILEPAATTLNRAVESILSQMSGQAPENLTFKSVGKTVSFILECEDMMAATEQVAKMIPEPPISNPVLKRVVDVRIAEIDPFA